jgi:cobyrinic acid a,c-diamide synthase
MITKQDTAQKIINYLHHHAQLDELVDWAENAIMEQDFESETVRNIVAEIGVADMKPFGLQWQDFETMMQQLGYKLKVEAVLV